MTEISIVERLKKTPILIVDNDKDFNDSIKDILELEGYSVIIAQSVEEAFNQVQKNRPLISLIDIHLGMQNGIKLISSLKSLYPKMICVVMTAYAGIDTAVQALKNEAYDYLRKPLNIEDLLATLDRCYERLVLEEQNDEAKQALRKSEELYREFFEQDITGDFVATPEGEIELCNPPFAKIFGFDNLKDALKSNMSSFFPNKEKWNIFLDKIKRNRKMEMYETELVSIQGKTVYVFANVFGKFDDNNNLKKMNGYLMDITEYKRLEYMYLQSQKMEAIGRLAGGVAHDFNNLLTAILGYSKLLIDNVEKGSQLHEDVEEIIKAANRATELTQQLLTFSRRQTVQLQPVSMPNVIEDMANMLQRIIGEDIKLITELAEDTSLIIADHSQITQVILNLVVNARDAMPEGGKLIIRTENIKINEERDKVDPNIIPGDYVQLTVIDTGIGMDEETISHIFEPFYSTKEKGTGLGLATVFGIVKQCIGHISVESQPNKGVKFIILFPKAGEVESLIDKEQEQILPDAETILIVEDEEGLNRLIARVLKKKGYKILQASNGEEAILQCEKYNGPIHLVITDLIMPKMGGEELVMKLKLNYPDMKVLYMSGYTTESFIEKKEFLSKGVDFIPKPFNDETIYQKVKNLIGV